MAAGQHSKGKLRPPSQHPGPSEPFPTWSLTQQVRSRLLRGGCTVLAPLRPPGYHGTLLPPGRKRDMGFTGVYKETDPVKLTLNNSPKGRGPACISNPWYLAWCQGEGSRGVLRIKLKPESQPHQGVLTLWGEFNRQAPWKEGDLVH